MKFKSSSKILDRVHFHIEKNKRKFVLIGSSARKLKQQGVNLLAGRALAYNLFPFSYSEVKGLNFNLINVLEYECYRKHVLQIQRNSHASI